MNKTINDLTILRGLLSDELFASFANFVTDKSKPSIFLNKLFEKGAEDDFLQYVCNKILLDENAFSIGAARKNKLSPYLIKAYTNDLDIIFNTINQITTEDFAIGSVYPPFDKKFNAEKSTNSLIEFYAKHGYGMFISYKAFNYENKTLVPIANTSPITLDELKNYCYEKKLIDDNINDFILNLPYSNMLLYGDMGTGKSSTVHAMLNKYYTSGLRIIELKKEDMMDIPYIRQIIADNPLKFIIFIDDLSLGEYDDKVSSLKASLEGSVSCDTHNIMIVATSNRRHIVKESFSDRENSIHPADSISEQLSLADRFGLTVNFSTTNKAEYLSIVDQLAQDMNILCDSEKLHMLAERWSTVKGGRSPRRAKQFIDLVYSCEQTGRQIDF